VKQTKFKLPCPENKCDSSTLTSIIEDHVPERSIILTDCWKAYSELEQQNWNHLTVNHLMNLVDPTSGTHSKHRMGLSKRRRDDGTGDGTLAIDCPRKDYRMGTLSKVNNIIYCKNDVLAE